ncbi:MAG: leucine-rich repeat protein [Clostridia bacterium]|nr:leucine-rich repeat protein [Clostridia bacterium]
MDSPLPGKVLFLLFSSLPGWILLLIPLHAYRSLKKQNEAQTALTTGEIVRHEISTKRSKGKTTTITHPVITYRVGQNSYTFTADSIRKPEQYPVGLRVNVYYAPQNPDSAHMDQPDEKTFPLLPVLMGTLWISVCLVLFCFSDRLPFSFDFGSGSKSGARSPATVTIDTGSRRQADIFTSKAASDFTVVISSYTGTSSSLVIPDTLNNRSVSGIATGAFRQCLSLRSITIPGTVSTISMGAFSGCMFLSTVTLSEGTETIQSMAFIVCPQLQNVYLPASLTFIGKDAFPDDCKATFHVTPDSVGETYCKRNNLSYVVD